MTTYLDTNQYTQIYLIVGKDLIGIEIHNSRYIFLKVLTSCFFVTVHIIEDSHYLAQVI